MRRFARHMTTPNEPGRNRRTLQRSSSLSKQGCAIKASRHPQRKFKHWPRLKNIKNAVGNRERPSPARNAGKTGKFARTFRTRFRAFELSSFRKSGNLDIDIKKRALMP